MASAPLLCREHGAVCGVGTLSSVRHVLHGPAMPADDESDDEPDWIAAAGAHLAALPSCSGWLEKKSGGKEGQSKSRMLERWDKRWFVLLDSEVCYYKSEDDAKYGKPPLGALDCTGASIFLKEVKGSTFRFTVVALSRELKLRAPTAASYEQWMAALEPHAASVVRDRTVSDATVGDRHSLTSGRVSSSRASLTRLSLSGGVAAAERTTGYLEKKAGSKEKQGKSRLLERWDRRFFVLEGTMLCYFKSDEDERKGKAAAGSISCAGAEVFLKEVRGGVFRFSVRSTARELKLRAPNAAEYKRWLAALAPVTKPPTHRESVEEGASVRSSVADLPESSEERWRKAAASTAEGGIATAADYDDDDDDDVEPVLFQQASLEGGSPMPAAPAASPPRPAASPVASPATSPTASPVALPAASPATTPMRRRSSQVAAHFASRGSRSSSLADAAPGSRSNSVVDEAPRSPNTSLDDAAPPWWAGVAATAAVGWTADNAGEDDAASLGAAMSAANDADDGASEPLGTATSEPMGTAKEPMISDQRLSTPPKRESFLEGLVRGWQVHEPTA